MFLRCIDERLQKELCTRAVIITVEKFELIPLRIGQIGRSNE